ncbi:hypothetical protein SAMCCGM7_pB0071 (plasmid) [Sinorhizobium americanum CCGM7]|nr:hypothetical protein SAMCCGM7_pB0071 [Sinorhizobium americanum CCGM7]
MNLPHAWKRSGDFWAFLRCNFQAVVPFSAWNSGRWTTR